MNEEARQGFNPKSTKRWGSGTPNTGTTLVSLSEAKVWNSVGGRVPRFATTTTGSNQDQSEVFLRATDFRNISSFSSALSLRVAYILPFTSTAGYACPIFLLDTVIHMISHGVLRQWTAPTFVPATWNSCHVRIINPVGPEERDSSSYYYYR